MKLSSIYKQNSHPFLPQKLTKANWLSSYILPNKEPAFICFFNSLKLSLITISQILIQHRNIHAQHLYNPSNSQGIAIIYDCPGFIKRTYQKQQRWFDTSQS